ncbi:hypothetical protein OG730_04440 [Streptomyces sp. NBC_01298]|uniref:hypothetical protein n=1 Tax=Streptomyces sp. NBC_01298 TaxID=2903817 RepID=UPI002E11FC94|nr:hypothetical protein OG730_04440 [Streptomyces sp. NBC_01298]
MADPVEQLDHPLLGQPVRDVASGTEGKLVAVVQEVVRRVYGEAVYAPIAYIQMASGRELSTAAANVEAAR